MKSRLIVFCGFLAILSISSSCKKSTRPAITDKVPLAHVTGTVLVDGVGKPGILIHYIPRHEITEKRERYRNRFFVTTGEKGMFSLSTYVPGDGIPFGIYSLEFVGWNKNCRARKIDFRGDTQKNPIQKQLSKSGKAKILIWERLNCKLASGHFGEIVIAIKVVTELPVSSRFEKFQPMDYDTQGLRPVPFA